MADKKAKVDSMGAMLIPGFHLIILTLFVSSHLAAQETSDWQSLVDQAKELYQNKQYPESFAAARQALQLAKQAEPSDPIQLAYSYNMVGVFLMGAGGTQEAEQLLIQAVALREKELGPVHRDVAISAEHLGRLYYNVEAFKKSRIYLKKSLAAYESISGPDTSKIGELYKLIGCTHKFLNEDAESLPHHLRALKIAEAQSEPDYLSIAELAALIGESYTKTSNYKKAIPQLNRSITIRDAVDQADPFQTAYSKRMLAISYFRDRQTEKAEATINSLLLLRKKEEIKHPGETAEDRFVLFNIYRTTDSTQKAEKELTEVLRLLNEEAGNDTTSMLKRFQIGSELAGIGKIKEAETLIAIVYESSKNNPGVNEQGLLNIMDPLSSIYFQTGRFDLARAIGEKQLILALKVYGPKHPQTAIYHSNLGWINLRDSKPKEALAKFETCLKIQIESLPAEHPSIATTRDLILQIQAAQKKGEAI